MFRFLLEGNINKLQSLLYDVHNMFSLFDNDNNLQLPDEMMSIDQKLRSILFTYLIFTNTYLLYVRM